MRRFFRVGVWLTLLLPAAAPADPYAFRATVDRDSITVGDPIHLRLALELPDSIRPEVVPEIRLPESVRVLDAPEAVRQPAADGRSRWTQTIRLTSYRPGEAVLEDLSLKILPPGGDTLTLSDHPISILVRSVRPDTLQDILDVKRPVSLEPVIPAAVWVSVGLILAAIVGLWLWLRRRAGGTEPDVPAPVVVDWFDEVKRLRRAGLIERGEFDAYYTRLSEAFRRFLEDETGVDAMERATFEIRADLERAAFSGARILEIEAFLNEADLVKFAKFQPDAGRADEDGKRVLGLMRAIRDERAPVVEEASP